MVGLLDLAQILTLKGDFEIPTLDSTYVPWGRVSVRALKQVHVYIAATTGIDTS